MEASGSEATIGVVVVAIVIVVFALRFPQYVLPIVGGASFVVGVAAASSAVGSIQEITIVLLILGGMLLIGMGQGLRRLRIIAEAVAEPASPAERAKPIDPCGPERAGQASPGHGV